MQTNTDAPWTNFEDDYENIKYISSPTEPFYGFIAFWQIKINDSASSDCATFEDCFGRAEPTISL